MKTPQQLLDTRVNVFLAPPRGREKAVKPFDRLGHRAERIVDARPELVRRSMQAVRASLGLREDLAQGSGKRASPPACTAGSLAGRLRVSARRTPKRRVDPARSRARPTGSLGAATAGEPAHPLGPRSASPRQGLAGGRAPCDPHNGNGAP